MKTKGNKKLSDWLIRCDAIAECDSFLWSRHPEDQVTFIRAALLRAAAEGVNWGTIYRSIYKEWQTRRPTFPTSTRWRLKYSSFTRAGQECNTTEGCPFPHLNSSAFTPRP